MSMGSLGFNQGRPDEGWRTLTLPLILSPSIWALVNNHQWVGPGDRSLALRKINISSLVKAASHLAQTRKFHPRLSMMSQYQSEGRPYWAGGPWWYVEKIYTQASANVIWFWRRGSWHSAGRRDRTTWNKSLTDGGFYGLMTLDWSGRSLALSADILHVQICAILWKKWIVAENRTKIQLIVRKCCWSLKQQQDQDLNKDKKTYI